MRRSDVSAVRRALGRLPTPRSVLVFSPAWDAEADGTSERAALDDAWPSAVVHECERGRWDLDGPMPADVPRCDVGIICNTFMCSRDPALWLRHISAAVPLLVVQDLAVSRRTPDRYLSVETGDVARYSVSTHGIVGRTDPGSEVFDLGSCGYRVLDAEAYGEGDDLSFVALMRLLSE